MASLGLKPGVIYGEDVYKVRLVFPLVNLSMAFP